MAESQVPECARRLSISAMTRRLTYDRCLVDALARAANSLDTVPHSG